MIRLLIKDNVRQARHEANLRGIPIDNVVEIRDGETTALTHAGFAHIAGWFAANVTTPFPVGTLLLHFSVEEKVEPRTVELFNSVFTEPTQDQIKQLRLESWVEETYIRWTGKTVAVYDRTHGILVEMTPDGTRLS